MIDRHPSAGCGGSDLAKAQGGAVLAVAQGQEPTMSSREIAELVEKRHDNVRRTMDSLLTKGLITVTQTEEPTAGGGKPITVYHVNQRDSYVVVAQLSPEFTARLVDRWQELEAQAAQPQPVARLDDPVWLRNALLSYSERVIEVEAKLAEVQPKAIAYDRFATAAVGSMGIREAACFLQCKETDLKYWLLRDNGWMYRNVKTGKLMAYAHARVGSGKGYCEHKTFLDWQNVERFSQVLITPKGLAELSDAIGRGELLANNLVQQ